MDLTMAEILSYERVLIGKSSGFCMDLSGNKKKMTESQQIYISEKAKAVVRYAIKTYLYDWTVEDIEKGLTKDVLDKLCLSPLLAYIRVPKGVSFDSKHQDYWYLARIVYPEEYEAEEIGFDYRRWLEEHKRADEELKAGHITAMEKKNRDKRYSPPRNYYQGLEGEKRLRGDMMIFLTEYMSFQSLEDAYRWFSQKNAGKLLKDLSLLDWKSHYDSPVEFFHLTLCPEQRDEDLLKKYDRHYQMNHPHKDKRR